MGLLAIIARDANDVQQAIKADAQFFDITFDTPISSSNQRFIVGIGDNAVGRSTEYIAALRRMTSVMIENNFNQTGGTGNEAYAVYATLDDFSRAGIVYKDVATAETLTEDHVWIGWGRLVPTEIGEVRAYDTFRQLIDRVSEVFVKNGEAFANIPTSMRGSGSGTGV